MPGAPPPPRDCSLPSDPTCPSLWLPIFSASASDPITVSLFLLILSLPLQLSLPGCVPLHLFLCVSLRSSLLPSTLLYLAVPLYKCLSLCHCLSPPSHSPVLFLFSALLPLGVCSSPTGQPGDTSGHCPGSPSRSPPHARHLGAGSVFPLQQWGVEGAPGWEDTVPSICSGAPGPLTPSAAIKDAGSRGSEMIMIASARQPRSREPRSGEPARQRRLRHLFMQSALRPGPRRPGAWPSSGHRVMSPLLPGAPAALRLPHSPAPGGAAGRAELRGAGGVDVIGADAALSSIMDGDDADGGAKPARRGERNRNGERKGRGRETHPGERTHARARAHTHTHTHIYTSVRASHCHSNIRRRAAHTQAHAHALSLRHTHLQAETPEQHTLTRSFSWFSHIHGPAGRSARKCPHAGHTQE